jgi:uncharacterized protein YdbL (DUF1318 family)
MGHSLRSALAHHFTAWAPIMRPRHPDLSRGDHRRGHRTTPMAQWRLQGNRGYYVHMSDRQSRAGEWVLLTYRLPREPSAPRLALWRKLKRLGVAQLSDGLVALPADARTQEQLEWAAEDVEETGGTAGVWLARPASRALERDVAEPMNVARAEEYRQVAEQACEAMEVGPSERLRVLRRLRAQMRRVERRDFFRPTERERARLALRDLAQNTAADEEVQT